MDKRYQVFVSSTYRDLLDERQEVIQALLELDCIPAGMEPFPAANDDQWTLIKKVIDDCDYYIVIIAGRYGTVGPDGASYTEMEYRYAVETKKPVLAFLHEDPGKLAAARCEDTEAGKKRLEAFRALAQQKMCKRWSSPEDLGGKVSRSVVNLKKTTPAVGWVRADLVPDASATEEILRLTKTIEQLKSTLAAARTEAPTGTSAFAQGDELIPLRFKFRSGLRGRYPDSEYAWSVSVSWNAIFGFVSPRLIDELNENSFRSAVSHFVEQASETMVDADPELKGRDARDFLVDDADFQTIKVQLRALGLITKSDKPRSVKDAATYWTLAPYGDTVMTRLRAIVKREP